MKVLDMLWDGPEGPFRVLLVGTSAYVLLVTFLRLSGKRTLSKMNAFDLVITVALGSTLATILLTDRVSLAEGATAFALLIFLQYAVASLSVRLKVMNRLVKSTPSLLFYRGEFLDEILRRERVTRDEVVAAVRGEAIASLDDVEAVVLETSGEFSVLPRMEEDASSLRGVEARS